MTKHKDMLVPIATQAIAQILRAISPPNTLVHVGWGNGLGELVQWTQWQVPHAYVIEAEESKAAACEAQALALAQTWAQAHNPWQTICATLSAQNAEQIYHLASNPTESGLLPPESLQHAWPHLQTVATQTVTTRSLDKLWQDLSPPLPRVQVKSHTWLIIDCLPAADILSGGATALQSAHVVCARSLLADRAKLCDQMRTAGWLEVGWAESQHPAFGHAWFTRDTALELGNATRHHAQLVAERDALAQAKEVETAAKTQALAERDERQTAIGQALLSIETLTQQRDLYLRQRDELNYVRVEQQVLLDALEKAIAESQAQLGITNQAQSDLQGQLSAITQAQGGLQKELDEATKRHAQLVAERDALAQAKEVETAAKTQALAERDEQRRSIEVSLREIATLSQQRDLYLNQRDEYNHIRVEQKAQNQALEQEIQLIQIEKKRLNETCEELQARIRLMEDEISRTEGQIQLIKDLMLSDGRPS